MHDEDEIIAHVWDADGIITSESPMTRRVLESLTQCKVVLRTGVGYDVIDVEAATEQGIAVINIPDLWTREVANQAMSLLFGAESPCGEPAQRHPLQHMDTASSV